MIALALCFGAYAVYEAIEGTLGLAVVYGGIVIVAILRLARIIPSGGLLSLARERWSKHRDRSRQR